MDIATAKTQAQEGMETAKKAMLHAEAAHQKAVADFNYFRGVAELAQALETSQVPMPPPVDLPQNSANHG